MKSSSLTSYVLVEVIEGYCPECQLFNLIFSVVILHPGVLWFFLIGYVKYDAK